MSSESSPSLLAVLAALDDFDHPPPLFLAQRLGLGDSYPVTLVEGDLLRVVMVLGVHLVLGVQAENLPVLTVSGTALHRHHHRLLHLVRGDDAHPRLGASARGRRLRDRSGHGHASLLAATFGAARCFWVMRVSTRARSRRRSFR